MKDIKKPVMFVLCLGEIGWSGHFSLFMSGGDGLVGTFFPCICLGEISGGYMCISRQSFCKESSVGGHYFWGTW